MKELLFTILFVINMICVGFNIKNKNYVAMCISDAAAILCLTIIIK